MKKFLALPLAALLLLALSLPGMAVGDEKNLTAPDQQTQIPVTGKYEEKTAEPVYSVDIAWGSMAFTYAPSNPGIWDPDTLQYEGKSSTGAWIPAYAAGAEMTWRPMPSASPTVPTSKLPLPSILKPVRTTVASK